MEKNNSNNNKKIELKPYKELERKFDPKRRGFFAELKPYATEITQLYMSHLQEPFGLRLRRSIGLAHTAVYGATSKDRGTVSLAGLERMEVNASIAKQSFTNNFTAETFPDLFKNRAKICPGVTIDWIEGILEPKVEVEDAAAHSEAQKFLREFKHELIERTGQPESDNEYLANQLSGRNIELPKLTTVEDVMADINAYLSLGVNQIVVALDGRSGSGKSTLARAVAVEVTRQTGKVPAVLSTDDYHRGRTYLELINNGQPWKNWDLPIVYDTLSANHDVKLLLNGQPIRRRHFDFASMEIVFDDVIPPADIVIVEGLYAGSQDLAEVRMIHHNAGTGFATSTGRDLTRMLTTDRPNESITTPEDRLAYMVDIGEPTYLQIPDAPRNVFSASSRSLSRTAIENF